MIIVTLGLKCVSDLQASRQQRPLLMYVTVGDLLTHSGFKVTSDYGGYLDMSGGVISVNNCRYFENAALVVLLDFIGRVLYI